MEADRIDTEAETTSNRLLRDSPGSSCLPTTVGSSWWQRIHSNHRHEPRWWVRAFLKIREWSVIVAGHRWKTFIRRFNRDQRLGRSWDDRARFKYDPLSYNLSFEDKNNDKDEAGLGGFQSFSMRYAYATSSVHVPSDHAPAVISAKAVRCVSPGGDSV